jgi:hypothetical protein
MFRAASSLQDRYKGLRIASIVIVTQNVGRSAKFVRLHDVDSPT